MTEDVLALARRGFRAWQEGDFQTLEEMLDPAVTWRWYEPGEWDCQDRVDVMRTLRERHGQGFGRSSLDFILLANDTIVVVAHPPEAGEGGEWLGEAATVVRFRNGRVIAMQDYRSKDEAVAASQALWSAQDGGIDE